MDVIAMARSSESIYSLLIIIADPHNHSLSLSHLQRAHTHKTHKRKKSFDDNWAFYYALKELFNIVFHKLAAFNIHTHSTIIARNGKFVCRVRTMNKTDPGALDWSVSTLPRIHTPPPSTS